MYRLIGELVDQRSYFFVVAVEHDLVRELANVSPQNRDRIVKSLFVKNLVRLLRFDCIAKGSVQINPAKVKIASTQTAN